MPHAGFDPAIPENERSQNHVLDRAPIGFGSNTYAESMLPVPASKRLLIYVTTWFLSVHHTARPSTQIHGEKASPALSPLGRFVPQVGGDWGAALSSLLNRRLLTISSLQNFRPFRPRNMSSNKIIVALFSPNYLTPEVWLKLTFQKIS